MDIILTLILTLLAIFWTLLFQRGCVEQTSMTRFCIALIWTAIGFLWITFAFIEPGYVWMIA